MIEYLETKPLELPTEVTKRKSMRKGEGTLSANIARGDLFLTNAQGKAYRLSWDNKSSSKKDPRTLPSGKYHLRTYRIEHEEKGISWHISGTAHKIQEIEVLAGKDAMVAIDSRIHMGSRVSGKRGMMKISGTKGAGLTIYRSGARIPIEYRVLDADKNVLATGMMEYG